MIIMKKSTVLFASAMMLAAGTADAQSLMRHKRIESSIKSVEGSKVMMAQDDNPRTLKYENRFFKAASQQAVFKPAKELVYTYSEEGEWTLEGEYSYSYSTDKNGNAVKTQTQVSGDEVLLTETVTSKDGLTKTIVEQTSADGGKTFANESKLVYTYDPVVTDLVVMKQRYVWDETNGWTEISDAFKRDITRDGNGNITSLVISVPYQGAFDPIERYTNTVDAKTGQIAAYRYEKLAYDDNYQPVWNTDEYLTDIVWHETNGQLVSQYDEWMQWGNKLASANLAYEENGETKSLGNIRVDYNSDGVGYSEVFNYTDVLGRTNTEKTLNDANGSFTIEEKTLEDANGDGVLTDNELTGWTKETVAYDDNKNLVADDIYEYDEDAKALAHTMGEKTDYVYDAEHGNEPKETVSSSYDMDADAYVPYSKVVVTSFIDVTSGIRDINTDNDMAGDADGVYTVQGMKVGKSALSAKGLVILKKGDKAIKVVR